jgi:sulfite reductase alpha subunit-like flavoprotein
MEDRPKVVILYATQTGNALDAAERMAREAERRACPHLLLSIDQYDVVCLPFSTFYFLLYLCQLVYL